MRYSLKAAQGVAYLMTIVSWHSVVTATTIFTLTNPLYVLAHLIFRYVSWLKCYLDVHFIRGKWNHQKVELLVLRLHIWSWSAVVTIQTAGS